MTRRLRPAYPAGKAGMVQPALTKEMTMTTETTTTTDEGQNGNNKPNYSQRFGTASARKPLTSRSARPG